MLKKKIFILFAIFTCISAIQYSAIAQDNAVKASIQPTEIAIGQQAVISLEAVAPKGTNIAFPIYGDTIVSGVEVLSMPKPDTTFTNNVMSVVQKYVVTSFDSASYHVPYMVVVEGVDTLKSNDLDLKVSSPALSQATTSYLDQLKQNPNDSLDIDKLGVFGVKTVIDPPFVWQDYILYGLAILLFIAVIVALIFGIYLYKQKKQKGYFFKPKVIEPPHVIALTALSQIKEEKLWQQGREKEYFTKLTDVLREYISNRFKINAFEMTSDEILAFAKGFIESDMSYENLSQVLKLADLVKFAKYKPYPDENDLSLKNSIQFVEQTKKEETKPEDDKKVTSALVVDDEQIDWTIPKDDSRIDDNEMNTNNKTGN